MLLDYVTSAGLLVVYFLLEKGVTCTGRYRYSVSLKNVPTLASCGFDKHGLILTIM